MLFLTVAVISILACCEMDLFIPSLSEIRKHFAISPFEVELLVSANLISFCVFSLFAGSLGDKYGRKIIILGGLTVFIIGSVATVIADSFELLLIGRIFQGMGISSTILGYVILADMYDISNQQRLLGYQNSIVTVSMALAPVIGSQITLYYGWHANFYSLLILSIITFILSAIFIPEGTHHPKQKIRILKDYLPIIKAKKSRYLIFVNAFQGTPYWTYAALTPIIFIEDFGTSLNLFGFYQGANALCFAITSLFISAAIKYFGESKLNNRAILIVIGLDLLLVLMAILGVNSALPYVIVVCGIATAMVAPFTILYPYLLDSYKGAKGRITALTQSFRLVLTAIAIQLVSYFHNSTMGPLVITMLISMLIMYYFYIKLINKNLLVYSS